LWEVINETYPTVLETLVRTGYDTRLGGEVEDVTLRAHAAYIERAVLADETVGHPRSAVHSRLDQIVYLRAVHIDMGVTAAVSVIWCGLMFFIVIVRMVIMVMIMLPTLMFPMFMLRVFPPIIDDISDIHIPAHSVDNIIESLKDSALIDNLFGRLT
jgi:hypothetical protein